MMSITSNYTHTLSDDLEQYAFPSALNSKRNHFIDRCDGRPWDLSIADFSESLSLEDARTLVAEIEALCEFMAKLTPVELHRATEPGEPDHAGIGGGL